MAEDERAEEAGIIIQIRNGSDLDQDGMVELVRSSQVWDTF